MHARNVISIVDIYRKAQKRLGLLREQGIAVEEIQPNVVPAAVGELLRQLDKTAGKADGDRQLRGRVGPASIRH